MQLDESLQFSPTLQFSLKARELRKNGKDIISLGLGEPDFDTPDHIKQAAIDALHAGMTRYSAAAGLPELRELIADDLNSRCGFSAAADQIIVTPGAKNALFVLCAALLQPGDEIINLTPCYVSYIPIFKIAEPKAVIHNVGMLADNEFRLDQDRIASLISDKTKLIVINYPNNPSGKMIDQEDVDFLVECLKKNDRLYLMSDEIYERLSFSGKKNLSPGSYDEVASQVVTVNGFSKTYAMTGWRIGYCHAENKITQTCIKIHQQLNTNTAAFVQKGAVAALNGSHEHLELFSSRLAKHAGMLKHLSMESGHVLSPVEGGFFGFLHTGDSSLDSDRFAADLLDKTGVATTPGRAFGEQFDHWIRISMACETETFKKGLERIGDYLNEQRRG